jgi:hypothetical protein
MASTADDNMQQRKEIIDAATRCAERARVPENVGSIRVRFTEGCGMDFQRRTGWTDGGKPTMFAPTSVIVNDEVVADVTKTKTAMRWDDDGSMSGYFEFYEALRDGLDKLRAVLPADQSEFEAVVECPPAAAGAESTRAFLCLEFKPAPSLSHLPETPFAQYASHSWPKSSHVHGEKSIWVKLDGGSPVSIMPESYVDITGRDDTVLATAVIARVEMAHLSGT